MRNAQKNALMALFAAMEEAGDTAPKPRPQAGYEPVPAGARAIEVDPLWLIRRGPKGRA